MLAEKLLKYTNNFSQTIQATSMPAIEAHHFSGLCIKVLQHMRTHQDFKLFWNLSRSRQTLLNVDNPVLQRKRNRTRIWGWPYKAFFFDTPELFYKQIHLECLDVVVSAFKVPIQQHDYWYSCWPRLAQKKIIPMSCKMLPNSSRIFQQIIVRNPSSAVELHLY